jgi:hypothetical protein
VLVDEVLTPHLASALAAKLGKGARCSWVQREGWRGLNSGALLARMAEHGFTALVTVDRNIAHPQLLARLNVAVVVVLRPLRRGAVLARVPAIAQAVRETPRGTTREVPAWWAVTRSGRRCRPPGRWLSSAARPGAEIESALKTHLVEAIGGEVLRCVGDALVAVGGHGDVAVAHHLHHNPIGEASTSPGPRQPDVVWRSAARVGSSTLSGPAGRCPCRGD